MSRPKNTMLHRIMVVLFKEIVDNFRDRRSMLTAFSTPLLGPVVLIGIMALSGSVVKHKRDNPLSLPVIGAEYAPNLIAFLEQNNVIIEKGPKDPEGAIRQGKHDVIMEISAEYPKAFREARMAPIQLYVDYSQKASSTNIRRAQKLLEGYGKTVGWLRLLARGVHPSIGEAVVVELVDLSTPESRAALLLAMLPYFIIMALFMGGYYIAVDSTAGELERGSLEPLLTNPLRRSELLLGKLGATFIFCLVGLVIALVGFGLSPMMISTEALGVQLRLEPEALFRIFLLFLPLTVFAATVQMIVATLSKSYKEAQTKISFLMLIPLAPGLVLSFIPFKEQAWMMWIPTFSEQILTTSIMRAEPIEPMYLLYCFVASSIAAVLGFLVAVKLFQSERLFGKR